MKTYMGNEGIAPQFMIDKLEKSGSKCSGIMEHLSRGTEEYYEELQLVKPVPRQRLEHSTPCMQVSKVTATTTRLIKLVAPCEIH
jgi:hypothetical protein